MTRKQIQARQRVEIGRRITEQQDDTDGENRGQERRARV